jgi:hypothetical protein
LYLAEKSLIEPQISKKINQWTGNISNERWLGRLRGEKHYSNCLSPFPSNTKSELDIFWHDGHSLGVDGDYIRVFEEVSDVPLTDGLQGLHCCWLKPHVWNKLIGDFLHIIMELFTC